MVRYSKFGLAILILLVILIAGVLISGCTVDDLFGGINGQRTSQPNSNAFLAPLGENGNLPQVLTGSPVQIMSQHTGNDLARVELWTKAASDATEELIRADIPENGRVRQQWIPQTAESYLIRVKAFDTDNVEQSNFATTIVSVASNAVSMVVPTPPEDSGDVPAPPPPSQSSAFEPPLASDLPACDFGAVGAPVLNNLDISNAAAGISANLTNQSATPVELNGNAQTLTVSWNVAGANSVSIVFAGPHGNQETLTSSDLIGSVEFQATEAGLYTIVFSAENGTCQSITDRKITLNAPYVAIAVATPATLISAVPTAQPSPTPTAFYSPPPPLPGIPLGPVQEQLPELMPPTCDAAEYLGQYVPSDTQNRVFITEDDEIAAKTTGGTVVHRAWRLRNIGTCMWGPGYELAFYGGRAMGSGGVAFEQEYPPFSGRPNAVSQSDRLIVPQGKPNETAVVEILLRVPSTPGIHQSYWRMRNPQGVFFGPILGVTLEVVRECEPGIYGAPVINRFQIKFINDPTTPPIDVFRPDNPKDIQTEIGNSIQLEWNIINATSYDIIITNPNGQTTNVSTSNQQDDVVFVPDELGEWFITLYVDNGPCSYSDQVRIDVVPRNNPTAFPLEVSSAAQVNTYELRWNHAHDDASNFEMVVQKYTRQKGESCTFGTLGALWPTAFCSEEWSPWEPVSGQQLPGQLVGVSGENLPPSVSSIEPPNLAGQAAVAAGNVTISQGDSVSTVRQVGGPENTQQTVQVTNVEWGLCPDASSYNANVTDYGVRFQLRAKAGSQPAVPEFSQVVDCRCGSKCGQTPETLPAEITSQSSNPTFNPDN